MASKDGAQTHRVRRPARGAFPDDSDFERALAVAVTLAEEAALELFEVLAGAVDRRGWLPAVMVRRSAA